MLFFVVLNLVLVGFSHSCFIPPKCSSESISKLAESSQQSMTAETKSMSSSVMGSEYESSSSQMTAASSSSSSNYEYSSSSSFDVEYYSSILQKCQFISELEREVYLQWLSTYSVEQLDQFKSIWEYLSITESLTSEISDYTLVQKDILNAYNLFQSSSIYNVETDIVSQINIIEQAKQQLVNCLCGFSPNSPIYHILKYSVETDINTLPLTVGIINSILKSQETYFSSSSSSTSTRSVESSSTTAVSSSGSSSTSSTSSSIDVSKYKSIFQKAQIKEVETELFVNYMSKMSSEHFSYISEVLDYLNVNSQVLTTDMIIDFTSLNTELKSVYDLMVQEQLYVANCDWISKKVVLEKIKVKLSKVLTYVSSNCAFYRALQYALEQDISALPLIVGIDYYILQQQNSYFSSSSSTTSTRSVESSSTTAVSSSGSSSTSSTSSSIDVSKYKSIFQKAQIKEVETELFVNYMSKMSSEHFSYISEVLDYLNVNSQVLTTDMIIDFTSLNTELKSVYDLMVQEQLYVANCDWISKKVVLEKIKVKLSKVLTYVSSNCAFYRALQYALEQDISALPLIVGIDYYILQQQFSYFSSSSSSSSTTVVESSSSSSSASGCVC